MTVNKYPELKEVPYKKTSVSMDDVVAYIKQSNYSSDVKRACYVIFRNESFNGNSGINENYIGVQADNMKWDDYVSSKIIATCIQPENMTGKVRRFACFNSFKDSIDVLEYKIVDRGLFIGGKAHPYYNKQVTDVDSLARAYYSEWVKGDSYSVPKTQFILDFKSMYAQARNKFI